MRPSITQFLLIFLLSATLQLSAKNIDVATARQAGTNFLAFRKLSAATLQLAVTKVIDNQTLYYIFNSGGKGFVIVAADDNTIPILAYSGESGWKDFADTLYGNNVRGWMESYGKQILDAKNRNLTASPEIARQWQNLLDGQVIRETTTVVTPLLTTAWSQGWPYNSMCPENTSGPGGHVWAGCVAIALAQILKYHNYPSQGLGSYGYQWASYPATAADFGATTYNWTNMPNSISAENNDVATLIYQTAVSCRSMWSPGSTGVGYMNNEDPMTRALPNYFKFAFNSIKYLEKMWYSDNQWDSLLVNELVSNRPVYYRGDGIGSHAFVCDGVDASNLYHFNFGWGGMYNGYFALSAITPGANVFTNHQQAIIGIQPNNGSTMVENTTWSGDVSILGSIAVPDAITLTVNAGATVKFAKNCKLQVWGRVLSMGTNSNYATFTAADTTTGWSGIKFDNLYMNNEVMSDNDTSRFIYTQIQYSDMRGVIIKEFSKVVFDHCKINNNFVDGDEYRGIGAGICVMNGVVQISNSEIYNNHAAVCGGGINIVLNDTPVSHISNNHFYGNYGGTIGGGFNLQCAVRFSDNIVDHNTAYLGAGGALAGGIGMGSMIIKNNKFCNNSTIGSTGRGGGLYIEGCNATIVNNLFTNNFAKTGAALSITEHSNPLILNCTISGNNSDLRSTISLSYGSIPTFRNTILYGNFNGNGKEFYLGDVSCDPIIDHCDLQGGINSFSGPGSGTEYTAENYTNTIEAAPLFVAPSAGTGTAYEGLNANWQLLSSSPCVNAGDTAGISTLLPMLDLGGNPRMNEMIDMGAYESAVPVSITIEANNNPACVGSTVTYTAKTANGGSSPLYQWKVNGANVGTNSSSYGYVPNNGDIIACSLTSNLTWTTGNPATSNTITMAVASSLPVGVSIAVNTNPICAGTSVTYTATPSNGGTIPVYQWKVNGVSAGTNSSAFTTIPVNGDVVRCELTSNHTCATGNPATSNAVTMSVAPLLPVSLSISCDQNPLCAETRATYAATPTNGGTSPAYQWKVNGANVGTNNSYFWYVPTNGDIVTCVLTSSITCTTGNSATSNAIRMDVMPLFPVSVSIEANNNPVCGGTSVTYTATGINGGANPEYLWMVSGTYCATNSSTYAYSPANGDTISCFMRSDLMCSTGTAWSNDIVMTVNGLPVSLSIVASNNPICAGTSVTFTATPTNGGTIPGYQWKVNGVNAGTNSSGYSYVPTNGDIVTCVLTSNLACTTNNPATSNAITMAVTTPLAVSVSIVANNNPICAGTSVTFTATPVNGGTIPAYQWKVNGVNAGTNSSTYTCVPTNGEIVTCVLTSNLTCTTNNPAISNAITMVVNTSLPVSVSIVSDQNSVCSGTTVTFTASPTNGGTTPSYQWKKNSSNVGNNTVTYAYAPVNGDVITCVLTSNLTCTANNPATSNAIALEVNEHPSASAGNDQSIGYGASTILNGLASGGSGTYSWHWEPAAMLVNADIQNPVTLNLTITEQFSLTVTDAITGCEGTDEVLVIITGGPLALDVTGTPATTCAGDAVQLMALVGGGTGNYTYSWSSDPAGFTSDIQNPVAYPAVTTTYTVLVNDGNATLSDFITVTVNPLPPVPAMPTGPDAIDLLSVTETQYSIPVYEDATAYSWELAPGSAGFITGFDTLAMVTWDPGYLGDATIRVKSTNSCGESGWSAPKVTFVNNTTGIKGEVICRPLVYPNPSNGSKVMISFCQLIEHVGIIDGKGQVLYSAAPGADHCVFQPALAKGIYFVKVVHSKGIAVEKLIVD